MTLNSEANLWSTSTAASVFNTTAPTRPVKKSKQALHAYKAVREEGVLSSKSPVTLITMLFDKACVLLAKSLNAYKADDDQAFHQSTLHALQIVLSLRYVLDTDSGSELSQSLFATYTSIAASLKKAKDEKDIQAIETIYEALDELRIAWHSVAR